MQGHRSRVARRNAVRASYDPKTDALTVILKDGAAVAESDEGTPGVVLDYDEEGNRGVP